MTEIIVGSTAAKHWGLNRREPIDIDIWSEKVLNYGQGYDTMVIPENILSLVETVKTDNKNIATGDSLYTIKLSHSTYDIKWDKTKLDLIHLKVNGCKVVPELYEVLKDHWKIVHGNKEFLSLMQSKEDFFTDNVTYIYDHDYLHELVAYPNKPMYSNCLKDGHEVLIDKDKFFAMPFENQVRMFREEITVIAAERWLINPMFKGKVTWYKAHMYSLRKTVTRLTKGWASQFIVENLEDFVKPDYKYFKHLVETLEV